MNHSGTSHTAIPYYDRIISAAEHAAQAGAPQGDRVAFELPDGDFVELPLLALPPDYGTAIASLCITETSFELEERLSTAMASLARPFRPEVIVGMPTLGIVLAASVARKLGHACYVPLSTSRKFWFDEALSVPVSSITSPGAARPVYLDPRLVDRLQGKRVVVVDDVISTGASILAPLALMAKLGVPVQGIVAAMQESRLATERLRALDPAYPQRVRTVIKSPLFRRTADGWVADPATRPD